MAVRQNYSTLTRQEAVSRIRRRRQGRSLGSSSPGPFRAVEAPEKSESTGSGKSFAQAFAVARKKQGGPGGIFEWRGKKFTTEWREEKAAREKKGLTWKQAYADKSAPPPIPGLGTPDFKRFPSASKPVTPTTAKPRDPETGSPGLGTTAKVAIGAGLTALVGAGAVYLGRRLRSPSLVRRGRGLLSVGAEVSAPSRRALPAPSRSGQLPAWVGGRSLKTRPGTRPDPATPDVIRVRPTTRHPETPGVISLGGNVKPPRRRSPRKPRSLGKELLGGKSADKPGRRPSPRTRTTKPSDKPAKTTQPTRPRRKKSGTKKRPSKREEEKAMIEKHVREKGVTRLPPGGKSAEKVDDLERLIDEADEELKRRGMTVWDIEDL